LSLIIIIVVVVVVVVIIENCIKLFAISSSWCYRPG